MAALNFTEIPSAQSGPERDQFELFAREFLVAEGFKIVEQPDRGSDGGRDIIVEEERLGPGGANVLRWLVSCKHKAHSGTSVLPSDEQNVRDRLGTHVCHGFIAFHSTLPSSGLALTLNKLRPSHEYLQLDGEAIERKLLGSLPGRVLAARYTPRSFSRWIQNSQVLLPAASLGIDPQRSTTCFFLRPPHDDLESARAEAAERNVLVFAVIYDPANSTYSKLDFALGYFMEYQSTKRLVDQHFVAVVGPSDHPDFGALVPEEEPLELCLWVVTTPAGAILSQESVYANPDEGMKRVRAVIAKAAASR